MKHQYKITVKVLTPYDELDHDDKAFFGGIRTHYFGIKADNKDEALDQFHETYPIACLDDFDIEAELIKGE